jgi:hypothetical protein
MHFFALRLVCPKCRNAFLFGGGGEHDLTAWRQATVSCRVCATPLPTADAEAVDLRALRPVDASGRTICATPVRSTTRRAPLPA